MLLTILSARRRGLEGGGGGRGGRSKKGRIDKNSDARCGRSDRSNSVRGVECEEYEKTWTVVWGCNPQEGNRGHGLVLSSHDRNGWSYRRMNEVLKG